MKTFFELTEELTLFEAYDDLPVGKAIAGHASKFKPSNQKSKVAVFAKQAGKVLKSFEINTFFVDGKPASYSDWDAARESGGDRARGVLKVKLSAKGWIVDPKQPSGDMAGEFDKYKPKQVLTDEVLIKLFDELAKR